MSDYQKATNFTAKDSLPSGNSGKIIKGTEIDTEFTAVASAISSKSDINSPTFTGTPAAPTATAGSNTTQVATTAFVTAAVADTASSASTLTNKTINLTSNTLTGTTAQFNTALSDDNFATIAGTETLTNKTLTNPTVTTGSFASPTLTGTPVAPTATAGTSTTQLATTAFVTAALQAMYPVGSIYINAAVSTSPTTLLGFGTWTEFGAGRVMVGLSASDTLFDTLEETGGTKDSVIVSHSHTATVTDSGHSHTFTQMDSYGGNFQPTALDRIPGGNTVVGTHTSSSGIITSATTGISVANSTTGVSGTNANVQPFIVVKMWKRTA